MAFPGGSDGKESACNEGDLGSIPGLGRCPGGDLDNTLQYSCLENPHRQRSLAGYSPWGCKESYSVYDRVTKHTLIPSSLISVKTYLIIGLPWWLSGEESICQCRRRRFDPWCRKIPRAVEQPGPCGTTIGRVL